MPVNKSPVHQLSWLVAVLVLIFSSPTGASGTRRERLIDAWKPTNYNVSIVFNDKLSEITNATTEITILCLKDQLTQIDLDFGELPIDSVMVNNKVAPYQRTSGHILVKLPTRVRKGSSFVVAVSYHGKPSLGLVLSKDKAGSPSAVGDNWPDRVHYWIPSLDHPSAKATVTFSITTPPREMVVANGKLIGVENSSSNSLRWTYKESVPIPPYCMIIAVGNFLRFEPPAHDTTPLAYYVPTTDKNFALQGFATANPSLKFFSQTVAPYPYEKLALIVGATRFGGMENSSAIVFTSTLLDAKPTEALSPTFKIRSGLVNVVAHEIAHQWFGDSVTESTWSDLWLSEGFADYFAGLFIQAHEGEPAFQQYMAEEASRYFDYEQKKKSPIYDTETEDLFKLLNANNYQKGAWVLHMLRSELGDEKFFHGVRDYYTAHQQATATSEDLRAALEKASKRSLKEFFASWVYGVGHPRYELSWKWNESTRKVNLVLRQLQTEAAFPNAVPVELTTAKGKRRLILRPTGKVLIDDVDLEEAPTAVGIDPENTILKEAAVRSLQ
ncbi:MAG TPA: M1 family metallopeptidase [Pyrinomonadaceae bacterium]|nr:M1 family metallopeptidase [Pyrinomonadaceae bacterium]